MPQSGLGLAQAENQIYEVRSQNRSGNLEVESPLLCFIFWKIFWTDGPPFPWTALSARRSGVAALHQANIPISAFQTFISTLALSQIGPPPTHPPPSPDLSRQIGCEEDFHKIHMFSIPAKFSYHRTYVKM